tara:strand:- start:2537 stop:2722 length:186 start_codon:yes stop_codon:yes gene_type:complete
MNYKEANAASYDRMILRKLKKEFKAASKVQASNNQFTAKRRHAEDMITAKALGCTLQELTE